MIRIVGQAPLKATVFERERLRCNGCCQVFTAAEPAGVGSGKYDMTAVAMIVTRSEAAQVYLSGFALFCACGHEARHGNALQPDGAAGDTTRDSITGSH